MELSVIWDAMALIWCRYSVKYCHTLRMMTSSNGNIFRVTGPLCIEFTGYRWISHTKASGAKLWCFLWFTPEQMVEQTIDRAYYDVAVMDKHSYRVAIHFNQADRYLPIGLKYRDDTIKLASGSWLCLEIFVRDLPFGGDYILRSNCGFAYDAKRTGKYHSVVINCINCHIFSM